MAKDKKAPGWEDTPNDTPTPGINADGAPTSPDGKVVAPDEAEGKVNTEGQPPAPEAVTMTPEKFEEFNARVAATETQLEAIKEWCNQMADTVDALTERVVLFEGLPVTDQANKIAAIDELKDSIAALAATVEGIKQSTTPISATPKPAMPNTENAGMVDQFLYHKEKPTVRVRESGKLQAALELGYKYSPLEASEQNPELALEIHAREIGPFDVNAS